MPHRILHVGSSIIYDSCRELAPAAPEKTCLIRFVTKRGRHRNSRTYSDRSDGASRGDSGQSSQLFSTTVTVTSLPGCSDPVLYRGFHNRWTRYGAGAKLEKLSLASANQQKFPEGCKTTPHKQIVSRTRYEGGPLVHYLRELCLPSDGFRRFMHVVASNIGFLAWTDVDLPRLGIGHGMSQKPYHTGFAQKYDSDEATTLLPLNN